MAIFGDIGKIFFGGATTADVGGAIGGFFGAEQGGRILGQGASDLAGRAGAAISGDSFDVATPPASAGIDSPATLSGVSQTGQLGGIERGFNNRTNSFGTASAISPFLGIGSQFLRNLSRPSVGGAITGIGGALATDFVMDMFGNTKKLVITRKLQREVKKVFNMSMGNVTFISNNSMALFGKQLSEQQVFMVLFKTFKNQGPYVTKAAVRKTRSTIRKMETLVDLKDRLCPPKRPAARRKVAPRSTTITNVR